MKKIINVWLILMLVFVGNSIAYAGSATIDGEEGEAASTNLSGGMGNPIIKISKDDPVYVKRNGNGDGETEYRTFISDMPVGVVFPSVTEYSKLLEENADGIPVDLTKMLGAISLDTNGDVQEVREPILDAISKVTRSICGETLIRGFLDMNGSHVVVEFGRPLNDGASSPLEAKGSPDGAPAPMQGPTPPIFNDVHHDCNSFADGGCGGGCVNLYRPNFEHPTVLSGECETRQIQRWGATVCICADRNIW